MPETGERHGITIYAPVEFSSRSRKLSATKPKRIGSKKNMDNKKQNFQNLNQAIEYFMRVEGLDVFEASKKAQRLYPALVKAWYRNLNRMSGRG